MNEARIKKLASEEKIFKRILKLNIPMRDVMCELSQSSVKDEDVFSSPDFTFTLCANNPTASMHYVCAQSPDGKILRIVGYKKIMTRQATRK
jgi:hypothetical protein